eukprot:GHVS01020053.1.p1 GENE.GHVS01020053.1~~GHVS01020053.1.p1  ORF type:complete len:489 (+),score=89.50 GHVS01020053.1:31-1497(+)
MEQHQQQQDEYLPTTTASFSFGYLFVLCLLSVSPLLLYLKSKNCSSCKSSSGGGGGRSYSLFSLVSGILSLLSRPSELYAYAWYFLHSIPTPKTSDKLELFCYEMLKKTSRSFYAVIMELHDELRLPVVVFYLTLRALDTIEDDTTLSSEVKEREMSLFASRIAEREKDKCEEEEWNGKGLGIGCGLFISDATTNENEIKLLEEFNKVISVYRKLKLTYRQCIYKATEEMSVGMRKYLNKEIDTLDDLDDYCYYVAGLVGHGLTQLIDLSGLEKLKIAGEEGDDNNNKKTSDRLANSMSLFLQKTNITRDFHEDTKQQKIPRIFYPKVIWSKYCNKFTELSTNKTNAMCCLNEMICNALQHIPDVLAYCSMTRELSVMRFCATPQLMAVGTLARMYDNPDVMNSVVKIRKGEAVRLIIGCTTFESIVDVFEFYCREIKSKIIIRRNKFIQNDEKRENVEMIEVLMDRIFSSLNQWKRKSKHIFVHNCK